MTYYRPSQTSRRPYALRLPSHLCRRAMLSIRVHDQVQGSVRALASERGMSVSEYMARLLNDHLAYVSRTRGSLPVVEGVQA